MTEFYRILVKMTVRFCPNVGAQLGEEDPKTNESEFIEDYIDDDFDDLASGSDYPISGPSNSTSGARGKGVKKPWHALLELVAEKMKMGKKAVRLDNHSGSQLRVMCRSKRHDVGPKDVAREHALAFSFRSNIIRKNIVFRCDLTFKGKTKSLDVYGGSAPRKTNT